jgi:hypothetical protein
MSNSKAFLSEDSTSSTVKSFFEFFPPISPAPSPTLRSLHRLPSAMSERNSLLSRSLSMSTITYPMLRSQDFEEDSSGSINLNSSSESKNSDLSPMLFSPYIYSVPTNEVTADKNEFENIYSKIQPNTISLSKNFQLNPPSFFLDDFSPDIMIIDNVPNQKNELEIVDSNKNKVSGNKLNMLYSLYLLGQRKTFEIGGKNVNDLFSFGKINVSNSSSSSNDVLKVTPNSLSSSSSSKVTSNLNFDISSASNPNSDTPKPNNPVISSVSKTTNPISVSPKPNNPVISSVSKTTSNPISVSPKPNNPEISSFSKIITPNQNTDITLNQNFDTSSFSKVILKPNNPDISSSSNINALSYSVFMTILHNMVVRQTAPTSTECFPRFLVLGFEDGGISVLDPLSFLSISEIDKLDSKVTSLAFHHNGYTLVILGLKRLLRISDMRTLKRKFVCFIIFI